MPSINKIMAFEEGKMTEDEIIAFIQDGINQGWVWCLQSFYGRTAQVLIDCGYCTAKESA
jgi:hypothetical protein